MNRSFALFFVALSVAFFGSASMADAAPSGSTYDSKIAKRATLGETNASIATGSDPLFQAPKSAHPLMPNPGRGCNGTVCNLEDRVFDFEDEESGQVAVNAPSPFSAFSESVASERLGTLYNEMTNSEFALTQATWAMIEPAFFSAMNAAGNTALQMSSARFLAEQNARGAFAAGGRAGEFLEKSYTSCVANLTRRGRSFSAAQEACLGGWNVGIPDRAASTRFEDINISSGDRLHFKFHPDHPNYTEVDKDGSTLRSNQAILASCDYDDPSYVENYETNPTERRKQLLLTDLMFTSPIVGASRRGETYKCKYLAKLRSDWVRIFGDTLYSVERPNEQATSVAGAPLAGQTMATLMSRRIEPSFEYDDAPYIVTGLSDQTRFKQFLIKRVDEVYTRLSEVMFKRCKFQGDEGLFWSFKSGANGFSKEDFQRLSNSAYPFTQDIGGLIYKNLEPLKTDCAQLDPAGANSVTSLKFLMENADEDLGVLAVARTNYKFAQNIAAGQINDMINELRKVIKGMTGGQLESRARDFAMQVVNDVAGEEWNFEAATQKIQGEYVKDIITLQQMLGGNSAVNGGRS